MKPKRLITPRGFKPVAMAANCQFCLEGPPPHLCGRANTAAQRRGKKYEEQALEMLEGLSIFKAFTPSPWIRFDSHGYTNRLCQPDALGFGSSWLLVIEIKLRHTILAYWQLRRLYEPVLRAMYPNYTIKIIEVTKSFDPAVPWPEPLLLHHEPDDLAALNGGFNVLQWRP
jgi:hypothetical protein